MFTLLSALLLASPALAQDDAPAQEGVEKWQTTGWGWGGLPYVIYNSDDGVNVGVIGSLYKYNGEVAPYKTRIGFLASFTSKGILYDYVDVDALGLAGGKLRLTTRVLFDSRFSEPYCGLGSGADCYSAQEEMEAAGIDLDAMSEAEREDALRRWYYMAYRQPYGLAWARYELTEMPHRVELIGSYRGSYFVDFDRFDYTKYDAEIGDADRGFTSVLQGGIMVDNRDNEPSPWRGYWVEATVRGASKYWGSQFEWFGFNTTLRGYLPILPDGRLTLADRYVFDGIVGETVPTKEMDWMGGYQMYNGLGGARSMRGVRAQRYRGRVKMLNQAELRWRAYRHNTKKGGEIDFYLQAFLDAGMVGEEWADFADSPILHGEGVGLRIAFNRNFILRGDFAYSPYEEGMLTGLYLDVDNLW